MDSRKSGRSVHDLWNRCDKCGRFIALADFSYPGIAKRRLVVPESDVSVEQFEAVCESCSGVADDDLSLPHTY